jgi:hypothetical protein
MKKLFTVILLVFGMTLLSSCDRVSAWLHGEEQPPDFSHVDPWDRESRPLSPVLLIPEPTPRPHEIFELEFPWMDFDGEISETEATIIRHEEANLELRVIGGWKPYKESGMDYLFVTEDYNSLMLIKYIEIPGIADMHNDVLTSSVLESWKPFGIYRIESVLTDSIYNTAPVLSMLISLGYLMDRSSCFVHIISTDEGALLVTMLADRHIEFVPHSREIINSWLIYADRLEG